jgi:SPP1 Gp6-like portal protein
LTIWDSAKPFTTPPQGWLSADDGLRLNAYDLYDLLLANDSSAIKITLREDEENPIYVPTAKRIVKTKARYVCKDLGFSVVNKTEGLGPEGEVPIDDGVKVQAALAFGDFFEREMFFARFTSAMLYGLAQGDWCIYLYADPLKPEGTRISCRAIDPKTFFPIRDPKDRTKMVGVRMVEVISVDNKAVLKVQTWLTARAEGHPNYKDGEYVEGASITREIQVMEQTDWEDPVKRKKLPHPDNLAQEEVPGIFQLPIYHFKASDKPGEFFGISDIAGLERIFYGVNQAVTDEDVGLAMAALGVYVADQKPVDENGEETDWIIGPKRVVEVEGDDKTGGAKSHFDRVAGITSIAPSQDHIKYLMDMAESTSGVSDVALGEIESSIAESGIALAMRFAPLLDDATEKDKFILAKLRQLFHDLKDWFAEYESVTLPPEMEIIPVVGPKLPRDNDKALTVYSDLHLAGVIPTRLYIEKLNELGFDLGDPQKIIDEATKEQEENFARQQEQIDAAGGRLDEEAGGPPDDEAAA